MANPILDANNPVLQSPLLYLQAVGSPHANETIVTDGSTGGNHLRWDLLNDLADVFPLVANPVKVYRARHGTGTHAIVNLKEQPNSISTNDGKRMWVYNVTVPTLENSSNVTTVVLRFLDVAQYDSISASMGTGFVPVDFLANYSGIVKMWAADKMKFEFGFKYSESTSNVVRAEAISTYPNQDDNKRFLSYRGTILNDETTALPIFPTDFHGARVEYIDYIRFQLLSGASVDEIFVSTYSDTLLNIETWEDMDTAFLSDAGDARLLPDQHWRKYNQAAGIDPLVDMTNYLARWNAPDGLKVAVLDYLSGTTEITPPIESQPGDGVENSELVTFTYTDLFKIASVDFNIAIMMGLGFIDVAAKEAHYIYLVEYAHDNSKHFSMSLPTSLLDVRFPQKPTIELHYGIGGDGSDCNQGVDENGYSQFETARYMNIRREPFQYEKGVPSFFDTNEDYLFTTSAIQYGLRHQNTNSPQGGYVGLSLWEKLQSEEYFYPGGQGEESGILENGDFADPVYIHRATDPDYHHYALYSLNWFSRTHAKYIPTSPGDDASLSNIVSTDNTVFTNSCGIIVPPTDVSAQVIFKEEPPILTSVSEQGMLTSPDDLLVRVRYKWRPADDSSPPFEMPTKIQFFFRENAASIIHGTIASVLDQGCGKCSVTLNISQGNAPDGGFEGSILMANSMPFVVKEVAGSTLHIACIPDYGVINPTGTDETILTMDYISPQPGDIFVLTENLSVPGAWTLLNTDGPLNSDGISGNASVTQNDPPAGSGQTNSGVYTVVLPDPGMPTLYGGSVTIDGVNYTVLDTNINGSNLELTVIDGSYDPDDDANYTPLSGSLPTTYYPGTKLYLDDSSGLLFDTVYPVPTDISKITYIGLRAINEATGCASPITPPVPMVAVRYQEPVTPELEIGLPYATRPDFYGKSSYTFSAGFSEEPFAVVFYRADGKSILERLYTTPTLNDIFMNFELDVIFQSLSYLVNGEPGSQLPDPDNINQGQSVQEAIQEQVSSTFVPLTKQPILFSQVGAGQASPKPPTASNPYPMVTRSGLSLSFTDFTLDGANNSVVLYCAIGLNNRLAVSEASNVIGPIRLINSYPPKPVSIKKITANLAEPIFEAGPTILFEVNPFVESENIKQYKIYRAETPVDALSIHSMNLVKTVEEGEVLADDFSSTDFPPYGDPLFYRVVAMREVLNENDELEFVPSFPSEVALASIIDNDNPPAPSLSFTGTPVNNGAILESYDDVVLSWDKTVHNGKYYIYKRNEFGDWQKIKELVSNEATVNLPLADTSVGGTLDKVDGSGEVINHYFKAVAENASGMLSIDELVLVI